MQTTPHIASTGVSEGHVIEDEGTPLAARASLNFTGAGATVSDVGGKTNVDIPGGGGGSTAWNADITGTTHTVAAGANGKFRCTHASGCTITIDGAAPPAITAELLFVQMGGPLTVVTINSAVLRPSVSIGTNLVGSVLSVISTPTAGTLTAAGYSGLEQVFANLAALVAFGAANASLLIANETRAYVGLTQYGWTGSVWKNLMPRLNLAEFTPTSYTLNGVAQGGSSPWALVVPADVYVMDVYEIEGGGAGGGGGYNGASGGGGGGGGAGVSNGVVFQIRTTPGETLTFTPGAGGAGGAVAGFGTIGQHTTISGSVSGLLAFYSGGSDGGPGTLTSGGGGGGARINNLVSPGTGGTGAAGTGNAQSVNSAGLLLHWSGGGGGGATGTNNGAQAGYQTGGPGSTGGTAASGLGGGGGGGSNMRAKFPNGAKVTGGSTGGGAAAPALTNAADGYGLGGGGGAARVGGQTGAAGTDGHVRVGWMA